MKKTIKQYGWSIIVGIILIIIYNTIDSKPFISILSYFIGAIHVGILLHYNKK